MRVDFPTLGMPRIIMRSGLSGRPRSGRSARQRARAIDLARFLRAQGEALHARLGVVVLQPEPRLLWIRHVRFVEQLERGLLAPVAQRLEGRVAAGPRDAGVEHLDDEVDHAHRLGRLLARPDHVSREPADRHARLAVSSAERVGRVRRAAAARAGPDGHGRLAGDDPVAPGRRGAATGSRAVRRRRPGARRLRATRTSWCQVSASRRRAPGRRRRDRSAPRTTVARAPITPAAHGRASAPKHVAAEAVVVEDRVRRRQRARPRDSGAAASRRQRVERVVERAAGSSPRLAGRLLLEEEPRAQLVALELPGLADAEALRRPARPARRG